MVPVAQRIVQQISNLWVSGSNPLGNALPMRTLTIALVCGCATPTPRPVTLPPRTLIPVSPPLLLSAPVPFPVIMWDTGTNRLVMIN